MKIARVTIKVRDSQTMSMMRLTWREVRVGFFFGLRKRAFRMRRSVRKRRRAKQVRLRGWVKRSLRAVNDWARMVTRRRSRAAVLVAGKLVRCVSWRGRGSAGERVSLSANGSQCGAIETQHVEGDVRFIS